jgi:hypothetical protein
MPVRPLPPPKVSGKEGCLPICEPADRESLEQLAAVQDPPVSAIVLAARRRTQAAINRCTGVQSDDRGMCWQCPWWAKRPGAAPPW